MTTVAPALHTAGKTPGSRNPGSLTRLLAITGIALITYESWTLIGWLGAGPHQITAHRKPGSAPWWTAVAIETVLAVGVAAVVADLVRACVRERRLTFDAVLLLALVTTVFWDTWVNFLEPVWFYSTNWVNLNDWWGHAPLVVNAAAGRTPFPILMLGLLYPFFIVESRILCAWMAAVRRHRAGLSNIQLLLCCLPLATVNGMVLSAVMILPHLWGGAGMPLSILGGDYRWSLGEILYIGLWSTSLAGLRYFTDAEGLRLTERGLHTLPPSRQTATRLLATIAFCNLSVIIWSTPLILTGLHARPYPDYPRNLSNVTCDTPGESGSAYGNCPGAPGFRLPIH